MWHIHGEARDLSRLIPRHPGGADILLQMRGRDCTVLYETYHPQRRGRREGAWREATAVLRRHTGGASKMSDSALASAWLAGWALAYAWSLGHWVWDHGDLTAALALGVSLWFFAADAVHSGSHQALFHSRELNAWAVRCGFLFCPSFLWHRQHVLGHHLEINKPGVDPDIVHHPHAFFGWRVVPSTPWRRCYASWRAFFVLSVLVTQLAPSCVYAPWVLCTGRYPGVSEAVPWAPRERLEAAAQTALWYGLVGYKAARAGWLAALAPFCVCGVIYYGFSQVSHINVPSMAPSPEPTGFDRWVRAQVGECPGDFALRSAWWTRVAIGLNTQAYHHLFPGVYHSHFPRMVDDLEGCLRRHGMARRVHPDLPSSLRGHFRRLAELNDTATKVT